MVILLASTDSRRAVVRYKKKYVQEVLVSCLVKLAQVKSVVRWTDRPSMTIAVDWDVKNQTELNRKQSRPWSGSSFKSCLIWVCPVCKSVKRCLYAVKGQSGAQCSKVQLEIERSQVQASLESMCCQYHYSIWNTFFSAWNCKYFLTHFD